MDFTISPELEDLRTYTRHLMGRMEADLGTGLDWVAVNHWNTDNPHTHIVVRGRDDDVAVQVEDRAQHARGDPAPAESALDLVARQPRDRRRVLAPGQANAAGDGHAASMPPRHRSTCVARPNPV